MKIGFIGLGKMGAGIAQNLVRAGHQLSAYNRTRDKAEAFRKQGSTVVNTPGEAAQGAECVFTMLSDDAAVEEVVFGENGLARTLPKGSVHVSSSTISTALARRLANEHQNRGQKFLSAPVFGRPEAAEAKKLIVMAAGDPDTIAHLRPVLDSIGRATIIAGSEPWQANAIKVCGNFMIASMLEAFSEAVAVIKKADIDPHVFLDTMVELFGSPVYKNYGTAVVDAKFDPAGFELKLGLKDVRLALDTASEVSAPMPFASILRDAFISAIANGQAQLDWSSLALVAERNAGLKSAN